MKNNLIKLRSKIDCLVWSDGMRNTKNSPYTTSQFDEFTDGFVVHNACY